MVHQAVALVDIEAIKQLKARYCRHLDAKDWLASREIFTDDYLVHACAHLLTAMRMDGSTYANQPCRRGHCGARAAISLAQFEAQG
jgi:hypothetical protein